MKLPLDVSRCMGRFGLGPDDPICPRRDQCARYVAMIGRDGADDSGSWNTVPVSTGLCRDGDDYFIPAEDEPIPYTITAKGRAMLEGK